MDYLFYIQNITFNKVIILPSVSIFLFLMIEKDSCKFLKSLKCISFTSYGGLDLFLFRVDLATWKIVN
jgi:hypothetical protein